MSDDVKFLITIIGGLLTGGFVQAWFNRRKTASDAYSTLVNALSQSGEALGHTGETVQNLLEALAKVPQLESQLRVAQDRIAILERNSSFWLSFARAFHTGAQINADYIRKLEHVPPYEPPKFPTGPLSSGSVAQ